jgi:hypothetical protein
MVKRAAAPAFVGIAAAAALGGALAGPSAAWSAALGVALVALNFAANGLSLAWASTISVAAVFAVALGGFVVRLGVLVAAMFALNTIDTFSPIAFALAVVPSTVLLLAFEARLVSRGLGGTLEIPAEPAAARAGSALAAREAR